ncbi:MAG: bifunctional metallophosphatase/5'-nucleotidase [Hoeflea sp.]|uniref:bifunctional metallophosphatase/5'-nucleotidase n=1 Tax=Hoeflea sp. TaxID=1940281 RepID=UPI001D21E81D|nr:5'-nucleotidase C-terminal domain-containing protein [Hoeflea sp.]MBU4527079.1 bifunctional metallophosphatase/5'-nucleotidase [Alphaproteobacteria bacterium]MBU4547038.1 bifunctional metallophosphatase/5'-nucleotidase [Alphaproteobacteria bacterium]MBU4553332.1 bifunctional metallophosphatase/5'-nucleotidase [Alphaproteobacteria bacterium]MBV1721814.1 bifunctional metallophosphatase/5'-nucleotidase [Hoeflea sp.]MBV1783199.1 bifunctional metallophosphatase/5'-nucleotidase [Hoeflea sp.]
MQDDPTAAVTTHHLTLLQINDTHGYLDPHPELVWSHDGPQFPILGGFARIKSLFDIARAETEAVLAFDNGDTFHGTYAAVSTTGEGLVPLVNALGLTAMTGHWDFAWGPAHVAQLADMLHHPFLAANCWRISDDSRPFPASMMCRAGGLAVGVIGIAATILDKTMPANFVTGLRFTDGIVETRTEAARLRADGADLVLVLSHLGYSQDLALAGLVDGIDVILSGHTHNRVEIPAKVNGALLIQSGCHGSYVGRLDLEVEGGAISGFHHRLIPVDASIAPDPEMQALVDRAMASTRPLQALVVGQTGIALHRASSLDAPMDDALLAAIALAAGTDIAFSNGWRYGAPIPPGPVTLNDLWNIVPTDPPVSVVDLSGAEIITMIEASLESTFSSDPFGQRGGFVKRFRGLTVNAKLENPEGHRVEQVFTQGGRINPEATYPAAFITAQGVPADFGTNRRDLEISAIAAMQAWFADPVNKVEPGLGRLRIV